jgi:hypothetical protein
MVQLLKLLLIWLLIWLLGRMVKAQVQVVEQAQQHHQWLQEVPHAHQ